VAAKLPGKALAVFLAVHHRVALTGEESVSLPTQTLDAMGVSKDAKARALLALEATGLIAVDRVHGHTARVRLC
jgi:predicted transcriptional regulator